MFEFGCIDDGDDRVREDRRTGRKYHLELVRSSDELGGTDQLERVYEDEVA